MQLQKIKSRKVIGLIILLIILMPICYWEFFRPFNIGIIEFNEALNESDFVQAGFVFSMVSTEDYMYTKIVEFKIEDSQIPGTVVVDFSQYYGWYEAYYHYITITFNGNDNVKYILAYLEKKLGEIKKTDEISKKNTGEIITNTKYHWLIKDSNLWISPYDSDHSNLTSIELGIRIKPPIPFRVYMYIKRWVINLLPNSLQPKWVKEITPKL